MNSDTFQMIDLAAAEGSVELEEQLLDDVVVDQEQLKIHRRKVSKQLNVFFHAVDKFIMLLRVYPTGHPLVEDFAEQMHRQLAELFAIEDHLYVRLKATELLTDWDEVCFTREESDGSTFLWYVPSVDGLVSIEIKASVTTAELVAFLATINRASMNASSLDDDTITMLWERDLEHVRYHAVEGYLDLSEEAVFGEMNEAAAKVAVMDAAISPGGEGAEQLRTIFAAAEATVESDPLTTMQYQPQSASSPSYQVAPEMLADAFRLEASWSKALIEEWVSGDDLEYRLIEALLSIVRTSGVGSEQSEQALETIAQITEQLFEHADYETAALILKLVRARERVFAEAPHNPLSELLARLTPTARIEALIFQAQRHSERRVALGELLSLCDHDRVQRQILMVLADPGRELRALNVLLDLLLAATSKHNELQWLNPMYVKESIYFERILLGTRGRDLSGRTIMTRLLAAALKHDTVTLRREVLGRADSSWCTPMVIERYIKPRLNDTDAEVRKLAIEALVALDPSGFDRWLAESLSYEALGERTASEVTFLIRLALERDASRAEALRELLTTRGWFNERRRALARGVARALIDAGDEATLAILRQQVTSVLTAPALKEEYRQLLVRHGLEEESRERDLIKSEHPG